MKKYTLLFKFFSVLFLIYLSVAGLLLIPDSFYQAIDDWGKSIYNQLYLFSFLIGIAGGIGIKILVNKIMKEL